MRVSALDFDLPESLIAQTPLEDRSASRLLHIPLDGSQFEHRTFRDLPSQLREGDLLVMNNTRVSAVRLFGAKPSGGKVEVLVLRNLGEPGTFEALVKPARRLKAGSSIEFDTFSAQVEAELPGGKRMLRVALSDLRKIEDAGKVPLPPYIRTELKNAERYQTVYSRSPGSAAAPTAGLHFTQDLLAKIREIGVRTAEVTLDVGLDTFRPMAVDDPAEHVMHGETCQLDERAKDAIETCQGRIIAVGTTSARTLESFAIGRRRMSTGSKTTSIFITPGYNWQVVDGMLTNFHMPRTTMLLMVSALSGPERLMAAYAEAVRLRYRFLSFGDSMLVL
ncbi:MAG: tRNA preQ1(34) S-adenosylmethionine ribosyltransferase-isomerase QueA [Armatimonadetes bacterium]|nr:tRNA preQ1(34) S-adenosylmethionine ribosyltransferase-isomerase QueA [Armatimonadota bacterium]